MRQDSVQFIVQLLKGAMQGTGIKEFYDGDPDVIPDANLPALIVTKLNDEMVPESSATDTVQEQLIVKLVMNKKDDWSDAADPLNLTERRIRDLMEGRDDVTGRYLPNSVKGALRMPLDGARRIEQRMSLELGTLPRPKEMLTMEGHLTITVTEDILVDA